MERLLEHERQVNESKNEFVAIASHFLRTPLTTIEGYLFLLLREKLSLQYQRNYLTKASNEQKKLPTLVGDIISISSLEKGQLKLVKEKVSLKSIVDKVSYDYESLAREKGLKLIVKVKANPVVEVDQQKLTQVISNLVNNSIKFTDIELLVSK